MQAKVPQDVQREDKIIGPFSLKQFLYLIAAAMVGYLTFSIISKLTGSIFPGIMLGLLSFSLIAAFAVIEIQGRPLPDFMVAFIIFSLRPRKRIWQKDIFIPDIAFVPSQKETTAPSLEPVEVKSELEKLSHILDTRGWAELAEKEEKQEIATVYKKYEEEKQEEPIKEKDIEKKAAEVEKSLREEIIEKEQFKINEKKLVKSGAKEETEKEQVSEKPKTPKKEVKIEPKIEAPTEPQEAKVIELQKEASPLERALRELEFAPKSTLEIKKEVEEELKKQKVKQKETIKKFKTTVSQIEKIVKAPQKQKPAKKPLLPIVSFAWPAQKEVHEEKPQIEEYKIDLKGRATTPRVLEPTTNIKVDERELEDVLGETEKIKTLEKEIKEVKLALNKQLTRKKPILIKEPESLLYKRKKNPQLKSKKNKRKNKN